MARSVSDPLTRIRQLGLTSASASDLLAVAISRRAEDVADCEEPAHRLLRSVKRVRDVVHLSSIQLQEASGLDSFEVLRVLAAIELGRKAGIAGRGDMVEVETPEDVVDELGILVGLSQERFMVVLLDAKNRVIRSDTVHIGTLTQSIVGPREVFRPAVRDGASQIIVAHNHPSGDPTPSPEDIQVTKRLVEVGNALDIPVLDHLIIGEPNWVSLRRLGYF